MVTDLLCLSLSAPLLTLKRFWCYITSWSLRLNIYYSSSPAGLTRFVLGVYNLIVFLKEISNRSSWSLCVLNPGYSCSLSHRCSSFFPERDHLRGNPHQLVQPKDLPEKFLEVLFLMLSVCLWFKQMVRKHLVFNTGHQQLIILVDLLCTLNTPPNRTVDEPRENENRP